MKIPEFESIIDSAQLEYQRWVQLRLGVLEALEVQKELLGILDLLSNYMHTFKFPF
jgi:hypothetical protein